MNKLELLAEGIKQTVLQQCEMSITNGVIKNGETYWFGIKFGFAEDGSLNIYAPELVGISSTSVEMGKAHCFKGEESKND